MTPDRTYLPSRKVRQRYGDVSDMTLWRWTKSEKLDFPKPTMINGRRYWDAADLDAWDAGRAA